MTEREVDVDTSDGPMAVVVAEPDGQAPTTGWPTVLIFIDAPGLRRKTRDFMARLAGHGYRVVTPDLHHRHGRLLSYEPEDRANDPKVGETIMGWIASMTDDQIQSDAADALAGAGVADDQRIAVIGFCLGARAMVRSCQRMGDRVVAGAGWHPSFLVDDTDDSPHLVAASITQPTYFGVGADDKVQSYEKNGAYFAAVAEIDQANVVVYPGADHGYTWPGYSSYHEHAAEASWSITLQMFHQAFRQSERLGV